MTASAFICSKCGYLDLAEHVVLDRPCPACDGLAEGMTLVQCVECGDPCVPRWTCPERWDPGGENSWCHAVDNNDCSYASARHGRMPVIVPVVPVPFMYAVFKINPRDVLSKIGHQFCVGRVVDYRRAFSREIVVLEVKNSPYTWRAECSLRDNGEWWLLGSSTNRRWGQVFFVPGPEGVHRGAQGGTIKS